ncbi:MAG: hypothetical protein WB805_02350 [Candidatus Dormiibacterota bacterium]
MADLEITTLRASVETLAQLSEMLIEVVANGGSVSFMHPLGSVAAETYWTDALAAQARNGGLTGTLIFWKRIGPLKRLDLS